MNQTPPIVTLLRGQLLSFSADPAIAGRKALQHWQDGALAMADGRIQAVGNASDLLARFPGAEVHMHQDALLLPGFIDAHVHAAQLPVMGAHGEQLLNWLNRYTFPAEQAMADPAYAQASARYFLQQCLAHGTTCAAAFCTVHPHSADALFQAAEAIGMRLIAGKVWMDRQAPAALLDTAQSAYEQSLVLARRWHGRGRAHYAITPRFAPTSSREQLEAAGALLRAMPDLYMQTHLAENQAELAWVQQLFPERRDYLEVYEHYGLSGPRSLFGHGIHLNDEHWQRLQQAGATTVHCPSSNLFLGSGLFDLPAARAHQVSIALASDVGAGTSLCMLRIMGEAYKVAQLRGHSLSPLDAFHMATRGNAEALSLGHCVGQLSAGMDADVVVLDWQQIELLAYRVRQCTDLDEVLFLLMTLGDERCVRATYVAGIQHYARAHV